MRNIVSALPQLFLFFPLVHCAPKDLTRAESSNSATAQQDVTADDAGEIFYCGGLNEPTIATTGDIPDGPGFWITNFDTSSNVRYFLYENSRDTHPWKYLSVVPFGTAFVSVCPTWQGRIVRGTTETNLDGKSHNLGTWFTSSVAPNGWMWGGISFLEGCDGGGAVESTDGSNVTRACYKDLLTGAPSSALAAKDTGTKVLGKLVGSAPNEAARDWELGKCSEKEVWINRGSSEGPVIKSSNGRLFFVFHKGRA
ncbi:hypothetical protein F5Y08DRAFT_353554 [Xylaria arbuscula]|nr:hypothetical protein F5Y08DRAFT_353554 [Xylaria arbuscula]